MTLSCWCCLNIEIDVLHKHCGYWAECGHVFFAIDFRLFLTTLFNFDQSEFVHSHVLRLYIGYFIFKQVCCWMWFWSVLLSNPRGKRRCCIYVYLCLCMSVCARAFQYKFMFHHSSPFGAGLLTSPRHCVSKK